jgi:hypothetical protein
VKSSYLLSVILAAFVLLTVPGESHAQKGLEVGLRLGDNVAADLTVPIAQEPRLHPAVYFDRFGVAAYFDWLFRLSDGPPNLRFYPGVGPEMYFEGDFDLAVAGNFGVEWAFSEVPITIGVDWRPALRLTNDTDFYTGNWGFTARFRIGQGNFERAD